MYCQIIEKETNVSLLFNNVIENGRVNEDEFFNGIKDVLNRLNQKLDSRRSYKKIIEEKKKTENENILKYKNINLNFEDFEVYEDNKFVKLAKKEFFLLKYILEKKGKVLTRENIIRNVWNETYYECCDRIIDNCIYKLRKKFNDISENLETIVGLGYKLNNR